MKIYLAGFISGAKIKECAHWRQEIRYRYHFTPPYDKIEFLDPLEGEDFEKITTNGLKGSFPVNMMVDKDLKAISMCDLVIANMDTFGETRPPIGTICEITYAKMNKIPVIIISNEENYVKHPFMIDFSSVIVKSVDELIKKQYITNFYKAFNSATY